MADWLHINRPSSTRFVVRVRARGHRKYTIIGKPTKSKRAAIIRMSAAMTSTYWKRGDVLVIADYYDPVQIIEMMRR